SNHDDFPCTVTFSRNRRQPQQLCVGVCPAAARRIRAGVHHSGLKNCMRTVRSSTQPSGFVPVHCGPMHIIIESNDFVLLHLLSLPCCVLRVASPHPSR
ncbi:mucin TcMUCII, partial [Trypanosoma cruzi]